MKRLIILFIFIMSSNIYSQVQKASSLDDSVNYDYISFENYNFLCRDFAKKEHKYSIKDIKNNRYDSILLLSAGKNSELKKICDCKNLLSLSLTDLSDKNIPDCVFSLDNLEELILYDINADWDNFFVRISTLKKLKSLKIYSGNINIIPKSIGLLSQLERLEITNAILYKYDESFSKLVNLKYLDLSYTGISYLPKNYKNNNLIYLDISLNNFNGIPKEINNFQNLECLRFSNNNYYYNDDSILCKNRKLKEIYLDACGMEKFPLGLNSLQDLEILDVGINRISELPIRVLEFKKLRYLGLEKFMGNSKHAIEILNKLRPKLRYFMGNVSDWEW